MADIVFVTWDGGGNVPPALRIAGELARRGHRTRFLGHRSQEEAISAEGHEFAPYVVARDFVGHEQVSWLRMLKLFADRDMGRDLLVAVERKAADVVVVDALLVGAVDAARRAGLRYVPLQHCFDAYQRGGWLKGPMGTWARMRGTRPVTGWDGADLAIAATLPELDPGFATARPNLRFVGPAVEVPERPADFTMPRILVSFSTIDYPGMRQALQRVVDATAGLDAGVVVTTGPAVDPGDLTVHDRVEVHRFVPHDQLMPQASLVVGHGGHSTAMRALAYDLPLLTVPMHPLLDQPMVGRAVEAAGAGRLVKKSTSPDQLRAVIAELLDDGPHREAAARLGRTIRTARPAEAAATLIEQQTEVPAPSPRGARR